MTTQACRDGVAQLGVVLTDLLSLVDCHLLLLLELLSLSRALALSLSLHTLLLVFL